VNALAITPNLSAVSATALQSAIVRRDDLIASAMPILAIEDRFDADTAAQTVAELKAFSKEIKQAKDEAKRPVIDLGKQIEATAQTLTADIEAHSDRIGHLLGDFEAQERRKADEAERRAQEEARRIRAEADKKALAAMKQAETQEDALRQQDEILGEAQAKVAEVQQSLTPAPKVAAGLRLRTEVCFRVDDIHLVYRDNPTLVKLEANTAAIKAIIRANPNIQIPGLTHWIENKV
jgi:hypothetical protein